jgi:hypothetical protein
VFGNVAVVGPHEAHLRQDLCVLQWGLPETNNGVLDKRYDYCGALSSVLGLPAAAEISRGFPWAVQENSQTGLFEIGYDCLLPNHLIPLMINSPVCLTLYNFCN